MIEIYLLQLLFPLLNSFTRRPDDHCFEIFSCSKFVLRCRAEDKKAAINHQKITEVPCPVQEHDWYTEEIQGEDSQKCHPASSESVCLLDRSAAVQSSLSALHITQEVQCLYAFSQSMEITAI